MTKGRDCEDSTTLLRSSTTLVHTNMYIKQNGHDNKYEQKALLFTHSLSHSHAFDAGQALFQPLQLPARRQASLLQQPSHGG